MRLWFQKPKKSDTITQLERQVTIEVQHHKDASAKEVAKTEKIVNNFNKVINQNNFTIRIHSAAGGKH